MKLVGRIPVEPLDDERMTNIERRIVAGAADAAARGQQRRFSLSFGFAAATVVVVLGAGLVGWKLRGGAAPENPENVAAAPLHVQTDSVATKIDIGDARIVSDPSTMFDVTRPGSGVLISMTRGKVALEVGKRGSREPLIVKAGDTQVVVVGTQFSVDFGDGTGAVDVQVTEGIVRVIKDGHEEHIAANEAWRTDKGKLALADDTKLGPIAMAGKPDRNEIVIPVDTGIGLHERTSLVPDSHIPTTVTPGSGSAKVPSGPDYVRRPSLDPPTDPHIDLKKEIRGQAVVPALNVGTVNAQQAVSKYREMAAFGTQGAAATAAEASRAFYSIAVVQHLNLGRDSDAIATLDAYFRRFRPDAGKEYQAARWLQVRIRCLRKIDDQCRQVAFTYAHEYPSSPAAHVADILSTTASE